MHRRIIPRTPQLQWLHLSHNHSSTGEVRGEASIRLHPRHILTTIATTAIILIHLILITLLHQGDMDITGSTIPLIRTTHILHRMKRMAMVECEITILMILRL